MGLSRLSAMVGFSVLGMATQASALPLTSDLLTNFSAIVGDFSSTSDTEGPVIIGGNLSGSSTTFDTRGLHPTAASLAGFGDVNVYKSATGGPYNSNNLTVDVGGTASGVNFSGAGKVNTGYTFPVSYSTIATQLTQLSTTLSKLSTTPGSSLRNSVFTASPVNGIAVLDITGAQLQAIGNPSFALNGAQLLIINVDAATYSTRGGQNFNDTGYASNILWNFYDATSVSFGVEFGGTVLAPDARVTNSNAIDGTLFASSFNGNGELHFHALTDATYLDTVGAVPEASTWAMMLIGFAGLGCFAHATRRRAVA